jgi:hypothetical protein
MSDTESQIPEIKVVPKLSKYQMRVAKNPEYKEIEKERITSYIKKRYNEDPEYRQKRVDYQREYDRAKRAAAKALKELPIVIPNAIPA